MNKNNIIDFGLQPVSNRFTNKQNDKVPHFKLEVYWNEEIGCPAIKTPWPVKHIKPKYEWLTCFEPEDHLDELCEIILNLNKNKSNITIAGYSFKDDSTLLRFENFGFKNTWRIDPKKDLLIEDPLSNIETFQKVFNEDIAKKIAKKNGCVDVLIVRHVIEHAYNLTEFINSLKLLINDNGHIVFELPDCKKAFENGDCTTIWEEHTFYFFESSFKRCLLKHNLEIIFWKKWDYPLEDCMVAIVKKNSLDINKINFSNYDQDLYIYQNFLKKVKYRKNIIFKILYNFSQKHGEICILGAGHLSVAFISLLGLKDLISFVVDDNENKANYFLPIGKIPIKKTSFLDIKSAKLCLLGTNPQHHKKIKNNLSIFEQDGGKICSIFPNTLNYLEDILK